MQVSILLTGVQDQIHHRIFFNTATTWIQYNIYSWQARIRKESCISDAWGDFHWAAFNGKFVEFWKQI